MKPRMTEKTVSISTVCVPVSVRQSRQSAQMQKHEPPSRQHGLTASLTSSPYQLAFLFGCESILVAVDVVICQSRHVTAKFLGVLKWAPGGMRGTNTDESGDEAGDEGREGERGSSSD